MKWSSFGDVDLGFDDMYYVWHMTFRLPRLLFFLFPFVALLLFHDFFGRAISSSWQALPSLPIPEDGDDDDDEVTA